MGLFDYGSGNLHSAARALAAAGAQVVLSGDIKQLAGCDALVVPGVGAYAACMGGLRAAGGAELLANWLPTGKPLLGICVGHQVLFDAGTEHGIRTSGFGIWPGTVQPLAARRLPHMGWNRVAAPAGSRLFEGVEQEWFYFVHSYAAPQLAGGDDTGVATATHGVSFVAAVERGSLCSTQFHPEKSGRAGARLLRNWLALAS